MHLLKWICLVVLAAPAVTLAHPNKDRPAPVYGPSSIATDFKEYLKCIGDVKVRAKTLAKIIEDSPSLRASSPELSGIIDSLHFWDQLNVTYHHTTVEKCTVEGQYVACPDRGRNAISVNCTPNGYNSLDNLRKSQVILNSALYLSGVDNTKPFYSKVIDQLKNSNNTPYVQQELFKYPLLQGAVIRTCNDYIDMGKGYVYTRYDQTRSDRTFGCDYSKVSTVVLNSKGNMVPLNAQKFCNSRGFKDVITWSNAVFKSEPDNRDFIEHITDTQILPRSAINDWAGAGMTVNKTPGEVYSNFILFPDTKYPHYYSPAFEANVVQNNDNSTQTLTVETRLYVRSFLMNVTCAN